MYLWGRENMETFQTNYQILIQKLDEFIRKYYKNQLIRGGIYAFTISLLFYLSLTVGEYFGHFNTAVRTTLFYSFIAANLYVVGSFIALPLFHLYKLGEIISYEQAAKVIGNHFTDVKDKLTNTLQLNKLKTQMGDPQTVMLIEASINQKTKELKPIPFTSAIDLTENRRYLKFALLPVLLGAGLLFVNSSILKEGTNRLVNHGTFYEKPSPFSFEVMNKDLKAVQQEDFRLDIKIRGNEVPENAYIEIGGNQFKLDKENTVTYHYDFKKIQKNTTFKLIGDGYSSKEYELVAIPNPLVLNFDAAFEYPAYINKPNDKLQNTGDFTIPAGTKVNWKFFTRNTEALKMIFKDTAINVRQQEENKFAFSKRFMESDVYALSTSNPQLKSRDSIRYSITVIPDLYPTVNVERAQDSLSTKRYYFRGAIKDDYGFNKLTFNYRFLHADDSSGNKNKEFSDNIPINRSVTQDQFFYFWDASNLNVSAGDEIEYYFEIWDNDGVNGSKATRSATYVFKAPTLKEIEASTAQKSDAIKQQLQQSIADAKKLEKDLNDISKDMFDKKNLNWEDKKKIEDVIKRQQELEKKVANVQKENVQKNEQQQEYKEPNKDLLDKQNQLNDLMDKMMTPEMKKLMDELKKLLENMDKQKIQENLDKMKNNTKDVEKEMDRTLEIFKKMEVEQKLQQAADNLKKLADEQQKLSDKTLEKNADSKELEKKQDELNKNFEDIKKDIKELEKKNQELTIPEKLENTDKEQKEIDKDQKDSKDELSKKEDSKESKSKASKSQKSAADKMKKLANKMESMQAAGDKEQQEEDAAALRMLLENLVRLSFNQEDLMGQLKEIVDVNNPQYLKIGKEQRKLKDDSKMIEDSLYALSKRVIQISSTVNKEISAINQNIDKSLEYIEDRNVGQARNSQQYSMTSMNNLALLLSEALSQMQNEMESSKSSDGSCNKPGKGKKPKPSASSMRKMQENLNDAIKKLKEGKKPGDKEGQMNKGGKQGENGEMSEQLAKLAAQQELIRQELNKLNMMEGKDGKGSLGDLGKLAQKMEEVEKDLVNKRITPETIIRLDEIKTRLLESEKAEKERDQDQQRESKEGKNDIKRNPIDLEQYKRLKQKEMELLKTVPPSLSPYYRKKVDEYFQSIQN